LPAIGLVFGAIIGLLVPLGGGKQWKATAEVYLGDPLTNGTALTSSATSLGLATTYVDTPEAIRQASQVSGIPLSRLREHISTSPILGPAGTVTGQLAPLLRLSVTGARPAQTVLATNNLAGQVVSQFQPYVRRKLKIARARLAQEQGQVGDINNRLTQALNAEAALSRSGANQPLVSEYAQITATLANERSLLDSDITAFEALISQTEGVETPRVVSAARKTTPTSPSRRSPVLLGAIAGLLIGLFAAALWRPTAASLGKRR
jgi:uncharacterized protein involved in exopolysaccharide biosynthesis